VKFAGFEISLKQVEALNGPNYVAERAVLAVSSDGGPLHHADARAPAVHRAEAPGRETSIHPNLLRDLYARWARATRKRAG